MQRLSEAQTVVLLCMQEGWQLRRNLDFVFLEKHPTQTINVHRNVFNALYDKRLIELSSKMDEHRRSFRLTKRAADLPLGAWKNYYLAKAANR